MSIVPIRNLGIGGGSSFADVEYLIKNGVAQVSFSGNYDTSSGVFKVMRNSAGNGCTSDDVIDSAKYSRIYVTLKNRVAANNCQLKYDDTTKASGNNTNIQTIYLNILSDSQIKLDIYNNTGDAEIYDLYLVKRTQKYLYKNGVQSVNWDNAGTYKMNSSYTALGGFTLNTTNMVGIMPTTNNRNRAIITNEKIDLADYSRLVVKYSYNNGEEQTAFANISSVTASEYVVVAMYRNDSGTMNFAFYASSAKASYQSNKVAEFYSTIGAYDVTVHEVYLD